MVVEEAQILFERVVLFITVDVRENEPRALRTLTDVSGDDYFVLFDVEVLPPVDETGHIVEHRNSQLRSFHRDKENVVLDYLFLPSGDAHENGLADKEDRILDFPVQTVFRVEAVPVAVVDS